MQETDFPKYSERLKLEFHSLADPTFIRVLFESKEGKGIEEILVLFL